jgi:hypothetical protein
MYRLLCRATTNDTVRFVVLVSEAIASHEDAGTTKKTVFFVVGATK